MGLRMKDGLRLLLPLNVVIFGIFLLGLSLLLPRITMADLGRETGLEVPRFVSLSSNKINVRAGPGRRYPIKWIFQRQNLPVKIIAEFDTWRKIKDHEGIEGWVHQRMLSGRRWVVILGENVIIRKERSLTAQGVARLAPGVMAQLEDISGDWCLVEAEAYTGWLLKTDVWGTIVNKER